MGLHVHACVYNVHVYMYFMSKCIPRISILIFILVKINIKNFNISIEYMHIKSKLNPRRMVSLCWKVAYMHVHTIFFSHVSVLRAQFKADYEALQARMYSLPDKLTHDVMVCSIKIISSHNNCSIHICLLLL